MSGSNKVSCEACTANEKKVFYIIINLKKFIKKFYFLN